MTNAATDHDSLDGVVEIVEAGLRNANRYLANGYRLLRASVTTRLRRGDNVPWVRKDFTYVLGRSADVAHYDPPTPISAADLPPAAEPEPAS